MSKSDVLEAIDAEIGRLAEARKILSGKDGVGPGGGISRSGKKRRHMSDEARHRISAAQKKRWAGVKRAAKR